MIRLVLQAPAGLRTDSACRSAHAMVVEMRPDQTGISGSYHTEGRNRRQSAREGGVRARPVAGGDTLLPLGWLSASIRVYWGGFERLQLPAVGASVEPGCRIGPNGVAASFGGWCQGPQHSQARCWRPISDRDQQTSVGIDSDRDDSSAA